MLIGVQEHGTGTSNLVLDKALEMNGKLYKTASGFLQREHDPIYDEEDLVQEWYLKLLRHGEKYDPARSAPNTFVYNVGRRQCITLTGKLKRAGRRPPVPFSHMEYLHADFIDKRAHAETDMCAPAKFDSVRRTMLRDEIRNLLVYLWEHNRTALDVVQAALASGGDEEEVRQVTGLRRAEIRKQLQYAWGTPHGRRLQEIMGA